MATDASVQGSLRLHGRPIRSQVFIWTLSVAWVCLLSVETVRQSRQLVSDLTILPPWIVLLMVLNLFPLRGWQSSHFAVDQPVTTAAALVLPHVEAALVGFIGGIDPREIHGAIPLSKALFNRTQEALPTYLESLVAHYLLRSPSSSLYVLPVSLLMVGLASGLNYALVATAISLEKGYRVREVLQRLHLGPPTDFLLILLIGAVLGAMLATLYDQVHPWALLAFAAPILL